MKTTLWTGGFTLGFSAALVALLTACLTSRPGRPAAPAEGIAVDSPEHARTEIARLEQEIARARRSQPGAPPLATESSAQVGADPASAGTNQQIRSVERDPAAGPPDRCRYTRAICRAAKRICKLARYLGDADSRTRCGRAQRHCTQAKVATSCDSDP